MKKLIIVLFYLIVNICAAQSIDTALVNKLQNTIDSLRMTNSLKGISACVIIPGKGIWKGVSGDSYSGVPITPDMEFGIASNTKTFTGVLMLKLAENNVINLEDSLHKWLPVFNNIDSNITIRQLLNHTSGLADVNNVVGYSDSILLNPLRIYSPYEVVTWVDTPIFTPGTSWGYCNTNYILAGMIAEIATGQSFGKLLHDSILTPLQLDSTFLDVYDSVLYTIAHPWQGNVDKNSTPRKALNSASWSAGGMYSTSGEMAQWYHALMSGQILSPHSLNEMTTFVGSGNYGIGISETTLLGRIVWQHGGTIWGGYNSTMLYDTTSKIVISVFINQNPAPSLLIARVILEKIVNFTTNISEAAFDYNSIAIYPNPSSQFVNIYAPGHRIERIRVYNLWDELMFESFDKKFSISSLTNGIYIVDVHTDKGIVVKKFIKQ